MMTPFGHPQPMNPPVHIQATPSAYLDRIGYSCRRFLVDEFLFDRARRGAFDGRVLDVGGVREAQRGAFRLDGFGGACLAVNVSVSKRPHIAADGARLPFADGQFDTVLCSEVLEHVESPDPVLAEIFRVLSPKGLLLATVPFLYPIRMDPGDFGRRTGEQWRNALTRLGFTQIEITPQGGFLAIAADMFRDYCNQHPGWNGWFGRRCWRLLIKAVLGLRRALLRADRTARLPVGLVGYVGGFAIQAVKPAPSSAGPPSDL